MLIALDWGTSSLRAWLLDAAGKVVDSRAAPLGIMRIADARFEAAFGEVCGDWLAAHPGVGVLASGMIGSRQGWREAAYVPCPAGIEDVASALLRFESDAGIAIAFVPGVVLHATVPDVMRGEETQILGVLPPEGDALLVLPGTHCKWVRARQGRIEWFATFMTGELFAVLREHSILGRLMQGATFDEPAFLRGVDDGAAKGSVAANLFGVRTLGLFGKIAPTGLDSYLSGLLIGDELADGLARTGSERGETPVLIGAPALTDLYARAFAHLGVPAQIGDSEAALRGLWRIARAAKVA
ncbi:MAG: 2-dehydro-3-deoxygalactonokinase [Burkholderiales bacterium]|nr:2-dehydro-3-deoxygalactonokinase [Burkholderiales bacterium]